MCLVLSRPAESGIELGKVSHYRIQIQQAKFLLDSAEIKAEPCALGRIKMYFCLMQEIQVRFTLQGVSLSLRVRHILTAPYLRFESS